jgi:MFS family permease
VPQTDNRTNIRRTSLLRRSVARQSRAFVTALRKPSLRYLLLAYFGHATSKKAWRVAILIYAFDVGGVRVAAAVAVAQSLAAAVVAPVGASLGDRMNPARALTIGYLLQAISLSIAGVDLVIGPSIVVTTVLAAVTSSAFTFTRPVHLAALPDVARHPDEVTLGNAATAWVDGLASMIGPLIAGAILIISGAGQVMIVLAAICLVSALLALKVDVQRIIPIQADASLREIVLEGIRELGKDRDAATLIGLITLQYVVVGLLDVLLVVLVVNVIGLGSANAALLAAAVGAGSALGGLGSVLMSGRQHLKGSLVTGVALTGIPVAVLGLGPGIAMAAALLVGYGIGKAVVTVSSQTLLQRTVRDDVTARVFGVNEGLTQAGTAVGSALGPLLVLLVGPRGALAITGCLLPVATVLLLAPLSRLDSRAVIPGPVFDLLQRIPFLSPLPLRTLETLAREAQAVDVAKGARIIQQGAPGDLYYVISSGSARVEASGVRVRTLEPGDGFGEIALLRNSPRTASVTALDEMHLVTLNRDQFLGAVTGVPVAASSAERHAQGWLDSDADRS